MLRSAAAACLATAALASPCWRNTTCSGPASASFPGPWESNMYSPATRLIHPKSILSPSGSVLSEYADGTPSLDASTPAVVLDFGLEVGGVISLDYTLSGIESASFGLAFTEAKDYIGPNSDSSRADPGGKGGDGPLLASAASSGRYVVPDANLRGGFRYLTLFLQDPQNATLDVGSVELELSFQPTWSNLRAYGGYFHSDDELLNRIWYAGAYTVQTNSVPGSTGRGAPGEDENGWLNDAFITEGETVLLDGAKRDRWVWIGDMGTAVPSAFVGTGDLESSKHALLAIYDHQREDGMLPKAGPPHVEFNSDTYHMWAMIGMYNYLLYSGDTDLVEELWPKHEAALAYARSLRTPDGIVSVKGDRDWGRLTSSKERSSASMLLYRSLTTGAKMASWLPSAGADLAEAYLAEAETLRGAINAQFWDDAAGAFTESPRNATLLPQDANSLALAYGIVPADSPSAARVSDHLASNWTPIGPSSPELPGNVSPFITSVELQSHVAAGRPDRAVELMRRLWGWYLGHENGTQSTVPEGFLADGSWGYRFNNEYSNGPAYTSHAHCWGSGPTAVLTEGVVGLRVTEPAGRRWEVGPASFGELGEAQAGFTTGLGTFSAGFKVEGGEVVVEWDTPAGTEGVVRLPSMEPVEVKGGRGSMVVPTGSRR